MPVIINGTTGISGVDGSAASPAIEGSDTNTGIFFPAADTAAISTNGVERMRIASDGQLSAVVPGGSTLLPSYTARAWVNFNGTGTVAVIASGNVSSITDNGPGVYTINFTTAMPDINYAAGMFLRSNISTRNQTIGQQPGDVFSTGSLLVRVVSHNGAANVYGDDAQIVTIAIFR